MFHTEHIAIILCIKFRDDISEASCWECKNEVKKNSNTYSQIDRNSVNWEAKIIRREGLPCENTGSESSLNSHGCMSPPTWRCAWVHPCELKNSQVIFKQKREVLGSRASCLFCFLFFFFFFFFLSRFSCTLSSSHWGGLAGPGLPWPAASNVPSPLIYLWVPTTPGHHHGSLGHIPNWKITTKMLIFTKGGKSTSSLSSSIFLDPHPPKPGCWPRALLKGTEGPARWDVILGMTCRLLWGEVLPQKG